MRDRGRQQLWVLSLVLMLASFAGFLLLPLGSSSSVIQENAMGPHGLMPLLEFRASGEEPLLARYMELAHRPSLAREWLLREIAGIGLESSLHSVQEGADNIICVLRANRGDGKEALVLTSRWVRGSIAVC